MTLRNDWTRGEDFTNEDVNELTGTVMAHGKLIRGLQALPKPADGHTPTITMTADQITVDGEVTGPHLTGPKGAATVVTMQGDQLALDGVLQPQHLTGPKGESPVVTMQGDQLVIDGVLQPQHLTGPEGESLGVTMTPLTDADLAV